MTVITDKNVAYFIIRNVTHSETSINETAEKKSLPLHLRGKWLSAYWLNLVGLNGKNVWRSIRASWPFAPSVGPSPSFNKYIHCSTTDQLPNRRWLPRADWSCKEAKKLTGYAILKLSMTTLRHGNAHLLVHLSKVQNSRVVEFDDRRRLHVICTAITFLS